MRIRLEKPAVDIWKLTGGKNEKARRRALHEKLRLDLYFVYRKHWMEVKATNMWYADRRLSNWNLLHIYNAQQTEVISGVWFTFITYKLWEHLVEFLVLFNDYDVATLKIIHPITFRNYTKHPIKVLRNKNNIMYMQPFYETVPRTPSEYFCTECI